MTLPQINMSSTRAIILAAGKGTRMNSDLPKVAMPLAGRSMLMHVIDNLVKVGIKHLILVVGYKKEEIMKMVPEIPGITIEYVEQKEQLGTAHAVLVTKEVLESFNGQVLVTNGDMPLIRPATFAQLLQTHQDKAYGATVLSSILDNPHGYGRLVRDESGNLLGIVEEKDADEDIRKIQEVNSGTYIFESPEIFDVIQKIGTDNKQNEYYLPDALKYLRESGKAVGSFSVEDSSEALGANSKEDLAVLEEKIKARA